LRCAAPPARGPPRRDRHARGAALPHRRGAPRPGLPPASGGPAVSARATLATAGRVLHQLRRDPRTIALIVAVPVVLETLLEQIFKGQPGVFQRVGGPLLGLFPFV